MEKIITPAYQISGKRKKIVGYIGELRDGETIIHSMEYSTHHDAEKALDALAFEILTDLADQGLVDELPPFDPSTCVFCHKPHAAQTCPEMRALLFAPDTCPECAGAGIIASNGCTGDQCGGWAETCPDCNGKGTIMPLDVEFAAFGPEV